MCFVCFCFLLLYLLFVSDAVGKSKLLNHRSFLCRTQPEPMFAEESDEDEEADKEPEWKKRKI